MPEGERDAETVTAHLVPVLVALGLARSKRQNLLMCFVDDYGATTRIAHVGRRARSRRSGENPSTPWAVGVAAAILRYACPRREVANPTRRKESSECRLSSRT